MFGDLIKNRKLKGKWHINQIDQPDMKGYIVQGRFGSDQPLEPVNPFEPLNPWERRPMPQRPFKTLATRQEISEPLVDVFDEDKAVKIYLELPGEEKDDIQLNVTEGGIEVKAKNFYKTINVPIDIDIDIDKASSTYNSRVLTVIIPKKEQPPKKTLRTIQIE